MSHNWIGLYTFITREVRRFLRTPIQALFAPWVSAGLYLFIFGHVVGRKFGTLGGVSYIDFVFPGVMMLNIITAAFTHAAFALYFQRFTKHIEELLVAPFSYGEMIFGFVASAVIRTLITAAGVYVLALMFTRATMSHFWIFLAYTLLVTMIFSFLGLIVGLWAEHFEHLSILQTFLIMPLTFLGGVFNPTSLLPPAMQTVARFNPFFYFVDGLRYAMVGVRESSISTGLTMMVILAAGLGVLTWYLFKIGWKIRN